jgi:hypothetical protein
MERRKKLATVGAVSLTATAAVVALSASVGLFGLTDNSPRVGKLSPIDSVRTTSSTTPDVRTIIVDDPPVATPGGTVNDDRSGPSSISGSGSATSSGSSSTQHSDDRTQATVSPAPSGDDHGTDEADDSGHSEDAPDSSGSGHDHDDD